MFNYNMKEILSNIESPLLEQSRGMEKITDVKELDKPITYYVSGLEDSDMVDVSDMENGDVMKIERKDADEADKAELVSRCPIEGHNGRWEGERGDSLWRPDRDEIPARYNPEGKTWGQILDKYGIDGIEYRNGEPDFSPISKGTVEIDDFTDDRASNFSQADEVLAKQRGCSPEEVRNWRKENGYTWHECRDCKTMQKVPSEVHNNMDHSGGVSEYKKNYNNEGREE